MPGLSNAAEGKVLDHLTGKAAYASPGPLSLALLTVAATEADTPATLTKANYTGYADIAVAAADWNAAGVDGIVETAVQKAGANCTGGSSAVIGWALIGGGDVVMFGTCPLVTITTTQSPPTIGAGALSMTLD